MTGSTKLEKKRPKNLSSSFSVLTTAVLKNKGLAKTF